jgi:hypothetical protein
LIRLVSQQPPPSFSGPVFTVLLELGSQIFAPSQKILIDLFVGTYKLSSHARLEAFVIQTKLNLHPAKQLLLKA